VTTFATLWRAFFAQFFASEAITSDLRMRQGIIWVLAFLIAPGISIAARFGTYYQIAIVFAPDRAEPLLLSLLTLFVAYAFVAIGLIAVFVWDGLAFDRRDAMVLGVLPLPVATIVLAKLGAMAAFLGAAHLAINLTTALLFAVGVSINVGGVTIVRQLAVHMLVTGMAALFVFGVIVTARGLLGLLSARLAAAAAAPLQFTFVAAMLCMLVLAASSSRTIRFSLGEVSAVPIFWFVGLYERLMGFERAAYVSLSGRAVWATTLSTVAALALTLASFPLQFQRALAPPPHPSTAGGLAPLLRGLGWLAGARHATAKAVAEFVLTTLVRNRAPQTIAAINLALAAPIIVVVLARGGWQDGPATPSVAVLWIPLVAVYWLAIGLRAAFFVPSERRAAWTFGVNAPEESRHYRNGVRGALLAVLAIAGLVTTAVIAPVIGGSTAVLHAAFVLLLTAVLAEVVLLTLSHIPFTQPYPPGHARLRTRWWIYVAGFVAFAYVPVLGELLVLRERILWVDLFAWTAFPAVIVYAWSWFRPGVWRVALDEDLEAEEPSVTTLGLTPVPGMNNVVADP
jgi:hypothetical protein